MSVELLILISAILGAIVYRIRGGFLAGWLPGGDVIPRLIYAAPVGCLVACQGGVYMLAPVFVLFAYLGILIPHGWVQNGDWLGVFGMGAVTVGRIALLVSPIYAISGEVWWPALAAGSLAGAAYALGGLMPKLGEGSGLDGQTEWGEAFTGYLIWFGLLISGAS